LIHYAYALKAYEDVKGDDRLLDQRFDIEAKAAGDVTPTPRSEIGPLNLMVQALLSERFKLVVRWEDRERPVYVLTLARSDGTPGPGLVSSTCPPRGASPPAPQDDGKAPPAGTGAKRHCGAIHTTSGVMDGDGVSMTEFSESLAFSLMAPVLDRTGLVGVYDLDTTFDMRDMALFARAGGPAAPSSLPSLFTAFRNDLGLKLETGRARVRELIVESVGPFVEN
jgi:uncharacterized protein (TIGR03435 family)